MDNNIFQNQNQNFLSQMGRFVAWAESSAFSRR